MQTADIFFVFCNPETYKTAFLIIVLLNILYYN